MPILAAGARNWHCHSRRWPIGEIEGENSRTRQARETMSSNRGQTTRETLPTELVSRQYCCHLYFPGEDRALSRGSRGADRGQAASVQHVGHAVAVFSQMVVALHYMAATVQ